MEKINRWSGGSFDGIGYQCPHCGTWCRDETSYTNYHLKQACKVFYNTHVNTPGNCQFCNKFCKNLNSLRNHERLCRNNPNRAKITDYITQESRQKALKAKRNRGTISNGAIKARQDGREYIVSQETREKLRESGLKQGPWSEEKRKRHSDIMKEVVKSNPDSYSINNVCGRVRRIEYKGYILLGKWELQVAQALDAANIKWTNKIEPFTYKWKNSDRSYFPDFYLPDYDIYLEVKGYERERDRAKWSVVPNLLVIKAREINLLKEGTSITTLLKEP